LTTTSDNISPDTSDTLPGGPQSPAGVDFPIGAGFPTGTMEPEYALNEALDPDPASVFKDVNSEDRAYWDRARSFVQEEVLPVIAGYWERAEYPLHLVKRLGELDLLRDGIDI